MKLFRRAAEPAPPADTTTDGASTLTTREATPRPSKQVSQKKGRPTPKRRDAERRSHGPVAPPPMTRKEARARRKALRGSKADRKADAAQRRSEAAVRRQKMLAGEEAYLLPRDKGPVKAFVRDVVDARRNLAGIFMPLALVLVLSLFAAPKIQSLVTLGILVLLLFMAADGVLLGWIVNKRTRERFPDHTDSPLALGWYAFVRASQLRKTRAPAPRVKPGSAV